MGEWSNYAKIIFFFELTIKNVIKCGGVAKFKMWGVVKLCRNYFLFALCWKSICPA